VWVHDVQAAGVVWIRDSDRVDAVGADKDQSAAERVVGVAFKQFAVGVLDGADQREVSFNLSHGECRSRKCLHNRRLDELEAEVRSRNH